MKHKRNAWVTKKEILLLAFSLMNTKLAMNYIAAVEKMGINVNVLAPCAQKLFACKQIVFTIVTSKNSVKKHIL